jgi:hypothetical protein
VQDPNMLRGCEVNFPFRTQYKLSGSYPLKYGFRVNGVFQSLPGQPETRLVSTSRAANFWIASTCSISA